MRMGVHPKVSPADSMRRRLEEGMRGVSARHAQGVCPKVTRMDPLERHPAATFTSLQSGCLEVQLGKVALESTKLGV